MHTAKAPLAALALALGVSTPPAPAQVGYDPEPAYDEPAGANLAPVEVAREAPPPLPVYQQPPVPGDGYIWVPGYWALNALGFYWVPGVWMLAPYPGALWTPGYWAYDAGYYRWRRGYWGPHIGFYGGINYGYGYIGFGYVGGYWNRDRFYYNRAVTNVNITRVTHVYERRVVVQHIDRSRVGYHGGPRGIQRRADPREMAAARERHTPPTDMQRDHARQAGRDRAQFDGGARRGPARTALEHPLSERSRDQAAPAPGARGRPDKAAPARTARPDKAARAPAMFPRRAGTRAPARTASRARPARARKIPARKTSAATKARRARKAPRASTTRRAPSARGRPNRGATPAALPSGHRAPRRRRAPNRAPRQSAPPRSRARLAARTAGQGRTRPGRARQRRRTRARRLGPSVLLDRSAARPLQ
ncbi:YXWGXW repeat-containing protein [Bordetella bronchiseptica]|uniref:YXWGXW repeat-containing protein n=1 Tax=Bordetella bronchiseptica TaxID=518 RepID=UPI001EE48D1C|nr:YXWGXW repeat-containing protein [Bordetella bronchiseptica]